MFFLTLSPWHVLCEPQRRYKCAYMRFSLSSGKKFISTLVPSGWVLWSCGCGSIRLHSALCGTVPPSLIMAPGQQYPLSFREKKNSFWNQKHYVVPQITTDSLPPGSEFTHTNPPPHSRLLYPICQMGSVCKKSFWWSHRGVTDHKQGRSLTATLGTWSQNGMGVGFSWKRGSNLGQNLDATSLNERLNSAQTLGPVNWF